MTYPRSTRITKPAKVGSTPCDRCGGAGGYVGWPGFTCYRCGGNGTDPSYRSWVYPATFTDTDIEAHIAMLDARNQRARERKAEKKALEGAANYERNLAAYPVLADLVAKVDADGPTGDNLLDSLYMNSKLYLLSERQGAALITAWERHLTWLAEKEEKEAVAALIPDLPEGTYDMVGSVASKKWVENQWGGGLKMVVATDSGHRVFGTVPKAFTGGNLNVGDRIAFTATVTRSDDDRLFGFFSRPRSAVILKEAEEVDSDA